MGEEEEWRGKMGLEDWEKRDTGYRTKMLWRERERDFMEIYQRNTGDRTEMQLREGFYIGMKYMEMLGRGGFYRIIKGSTPHLVHSLLG